MLIYWRVTSMKSIHFSTICPGLSAGGSMVEAPRLQVQAVGRLVESADLGQGEPWGAPTPSCTMWGPRDAKGTLVCKVDLWWLMYFWDRLKPPSGPEFPYWSGQKSDFVQNRGKAWYVDFGEKNFSHIENLQTWANQSYSVGIVIIWIKTAIVKE